jgi:hypothetical protein
MFLQGSKISRVGKACLLLLLGAGGSLVHLKSMFHILPDKLQMAVITVTVELP